MNTCDHPHAPLAGHSHDHGASSSHGGHAHMHRIAPGEHRPAQRRALLFCIWLTFVAMIGEFIGGWWTGSLMLLSDAVHMLSHSVSLAVSWGAIWMASRPRTARSHYGLHRAEILGSLFNALGLLALTGWIVFEAAERIASPVPVMGPEMIAVAVVGLVVNVLTVWILTRSGAEDLNTRSALLHMLALSEKLLSVLSVYSPPKQKEPALEASQAWRPPGRDILPLPEVWLLPDLLDWEQLEAEYRSRS